MKKITILIFAVAAFVSCTQKPATPTSTKGVVIDASMNNVVLVTPTNDTIALSTMALRDSGLMVGLFIGDTISVGLSAIEGNQTPNYYNATAIEVVYRPAHYYIPGRWVEPNPIKANEVQGIQINSDGSASSINMATLLFEKWSYADGQLTLVAKSIGNKNESVVETVYEVTKLDADSMVLSDKGNVIWNFGRQK